MTDNMQCPKCGAECRRVEVDVDVDELTQLDDRELARATLKARSDYCRGMF